MKDEDIEMRFKTESFRVQYLKEILYIHISAHLYFYISIFVDIYIIKTPVHHCSGGKLDV